jgi:DNA-binding NarL/FixJ family response regulator
VILYAAADLLWATRIKETATALGIAARPVRTVEMLEARLADCAAAAIIIDLEAGDVGMQMIRRLRSDTPTRAFPIVVFGPHVAVDQLKAAQAAGATAVMARGAFSAQLPAILQALATGGGAPPSRLAD